MIQYSPLMRVLMWEDEFDGDRFIHDNKAPKDHRSKKAAKVNDQADRDMDSKRRRASHKDKAVRNKRSAKENTGQISSVDQDPKRPPTIRKVLNPISGRYEYYRSGRNT